MATATRRPRFRFDLTISQADADELLRQSPFIADLDDYHYDPERLGHVYTLTDGRVALVAEGRSLLCFDPEDLD